MQGSTYNQKRSQEDDDDGENANVDDEDLDFNSKRDRSTGEIPNSSTIPSSGVGYRAGQNARRGEK